jgi:hypothetical protein
MEGVSGIEAGYLILIIMMLILAILSLFAFKLRRSYLD